MTPRGWDTPRTTWALITLLCASAVGLALVGQHVWGHEPCPWCVLQRVIMMAIGLCALLGMCWLWARAPWLVGLPVALLSVLGGACAIWQYTVAAQSASCNLTLADKILYASGLDGAWPDVFAPRASCAEANHALLGVPYALWALLVFAIILAASVRLMRLHARAPLSTPAP